MLVAAALLAGCDRVANARSRAERRADSLALAASGGVRTDSGAVPMRVSQSRVGTGDDRPRRPERTKWEINRDRDAYAGEQIDAALAEMQHEVEMQAEEAVAAAQADAESANAAAMAEVRAMIARQRDEMRHQRRMRRLRLREEMRR